VPTRATNHNDLLSALKDVNAMIQRAARLRVGAAKTKVPPPSGFPPMPWLVLWALHPGFRSGCVECGG